MQSTLSVSRTDPPTALKGHCTMKVITPTIGRKVWYWPSGHDLQTLSLRQHHAYIGQAQPFDATVIYVWNDRSVNLCVTDHNGNVFTRTSVTLSQPGDLSVPPEGYASWMPYQVAQADPKPTAVPQADAFDAFIAAFPAYFGDEDDEPQYEDVTYTLLPDCRTTVCQITLANGFTVLGTSTAYSAEQFDADIGEKLAYEDADHKAVEFQACIDKTLEKQFAEEF